MQTTIIDGGYRKKLLSKQSQPLKRFSGFIYHAMVMIIAFVIIWLLVHNS